MAESQTEMSFWEHLEVLRWALFRVLGVFLALFVIVLALMPRIFDTLILGPTSGDFFIYAFLERLSGGLFSTVDGFNVRIININVASQFMTHINTSLQLALILAFPYLVYELWRYIKPALFPREVRNVRTAFLGGTVMFYLGCAVGYCLVFPFTFRFLAEYELSQEIENQINLQSYISTFTTMILVMGIVFEMPLVAWLLGRLGVIHKEWLKRYRRHAIVALMAAAAFITPSGDPFTLMVVFIPLYLLYELSILMVRPQTDRSQ